MARKRSLGYTPGKEIILHEEDGRQWVETRQDAEPVAQAAKMLAAADEIDADFTRVALIPSTELDRAFNEGWFHDPEAWKRWYAQNPQYHTQTRYKTI